MYTGKNVYELSNIEYTSGLIHAIVFRTQLDLGDGEYVGFYVPKLLGLMDGSEGPYEKSVTINTELFANKSSYKPTVAASVTEINYIKIRPIGHSNMSQPIIALGESAYIQFIDGDYKHPRYTYMHNNEIKRATDEVIIYVYGKPDGDNAQAGKPYRVVLSSRDKYLNIHTSMDNGEVSTYDMTLNGATGEISIFDGEGNIIGLKTKEKTIYARNVSESEIQMRDIDIMAKCTGDFTIDCDNFKVTTKTNVEHTAGAKIVDKAPKVDVTGDASIIMNTTTMTCNVSAKFACTAPMSIYSGILTAMGLAISSAAGSGPGTVMTNGSGATLTKTPMGIGALGDKTVAAITSMLPFLKKAGIAAMVVSPMLPLIPQPKVKL